MSSLYWHDYETSGVDTRRDRPLQFAGLRTNEALEEVGEPLVIYCKPALDQLPHPEACLLTGITPQLALEKGLPEPDFIAAIHAELATPATCGVGYNTLRFDDEVTRNTLFRNFYDPYGREWQEGNSRWDLIDLVRMTWALRPQGIEWPQHPDGRPSFRLEELTAANGIGHSAAHDALSDVRATIGLARLLKQQQPRLYDWLYQLRDKQRAAAQLDLVGHVPVLHTSRMYPAEQGCTTLVMPLIGDSVNRNAVLVYDLRHDPSEFLALSSDELQQRLYTRSADLPDGVNRLPVKSVKVNKCPALAPLKVLDDAAEQRIALDIKACRRHWKMLHDSADFAQRVQTAVSGHSFPAATDVDQSLYDGFIPNADRARIVQVRESAPEQLAGLAADLANSFADPRLPELLFRYRARNWPQSLSEDEAQRWEQQRHRRLEDPEGGGSITFEQYGEKLNQLREQYLDDERASGILDALEDWGAGLC